MAEKGRRILVAVDEGEESMHALYWCLHNLVFPNSNDTLILLHCKPSRLVYPAFDGTGYLLSCDISATVESYSEQVADVVTEKAKKLCMNLQQVKVESIVENGDPRDVICEMAEKLGADVLVLGSPWIWTHQEGSPWECQQPLCSECQVPCSHCQEA